MLTDFSMIKRIAELGFYYVPKSIIRLWFILETINKFKLTP